MLCENRSAFGKVRGNQSKDIFPNTNRTHATETDLDLVRELDSVMEFGLYFTVQCYIAVVVRYSGQAGGLRVYAPVSLARCRHEGGYGEETHTRPALYGSLRAIQPAYQRSRHGQNSLPYNLHNLRA